MGKAKRNRGLRAKQATDERERIAVREAVGEILGLETYQAFVTMLAEREELLEDVAIDELAKVARSPGYGPLIARALHLLQEARTDPLAAWRKFEAEREAAESAGHVLESLQVQIDEAEEQGEITTGLKVIDQALPLAQEIGYGLAVCTLLDRRGLLLCRLNTDRREEEIEQALFSFEAALEVAVPGEQAARVLMHRGLAYSERVHGDPDESAERALQSMRDAMTQLDGSEDLELCAAMKTNLAVTLIRIAGKQPSSAREAAALCREALEFRSPERNADNWAYSQINLGYALQTLVAHQEADVEEVRAVYEQVLAHERQITDSALLTTAHHGLGQLELERAKITPAQTVAAHGEGELDELYDTEPALLRAVEHLTAALELTSESPSGLRHTRILDDLSRALDQLGEDQRALPYAEQGLAQISPESAPALARSLAGRIGAIHAARADWDQAADAYAVALTAAEITLNARLGTTGRETELESAGNLHRWAAYALARAGRPRDAVLALDAGQARELHRRFGNSTAEGELLAKVPAALRVRYEKALDEYLQSPIGGTADTVSWRLGEVIAAIRNVPGLAAFPGGMTWEQIVEAAQPGWPLVYVDPTPHGTVMLVVHNQDGQATSDARFVAATSTEIFMQLMVAGGSTQTPNAGSYLIGVSGQGTGEQDLAAALDELLPWLGHQLARPLEEFLSDLNTQAATLVLCGALNVAPLHAAPLEGGGVLADRCTIRYVPSALTVTAVTRRARSAAHRAPKLVALADPRQNLPAARPEVEEIAALFPDGASVWAAGIQADVRFLRTHAREATHLHLACHARGGLFDTGEAEIMLASGPLSATDLTTIPGLDARLVVVSACQSAQSTIARLSNEQLSIATSMIAAGSACVIASLWPVYDIATALLMTRLYEELITGASDPPSALRAAQLWLRGLTIEQEQAFLGRHPHLAAERIRRGAPDRPALSARGVGGEDGGDRPYEHPEYWAPFVVAGV